MEPGILENKILVFETPIIRILVSILCFACSVASCLLPWYFLIAQDSAIGSEHKMKWYFFTLTNTTTLSYTTQTLVEPFQQSSPNIFIALICSFAFQLASSVLSFIILGFSVALVFFKYRIGDTATRNAGIFLVVACSLYVIFSFVAIFQVVFTLPPAFGTDAPSLDAANSCLFNPSVCSSFMNRYSQSNFSWSWGPHTGWILALTGCLLGVGNLIASVLLVKKQREESETKLSETQTLLN